MRRGNPLFAKGNKLAAGKGRPKGSKDKFKFDAIKTLGELNFCPFKEAVKLYRDEGTSRTIKQEILSDLQAYVAPRLKAIELSNSEDSGFEFNFIIGGNT